MIFVSLVLFQFYVEPVSNIIINSESTRCENVTSFKECALIPNLELQNGVFLYAVRDEEQNIACPVREWNAVKCNTNW